MSQVYLDSMVWIYALEGHPEFGEAAQKLFEDIRRGRHALLASHFLLAELLVGPTKRGDAFTVGLYRRAFGAASIQMIPFTEQVALSFAELRAQQRIAAADSIHLALAASAGADVFVTGDTRLARLAVPGVGRVVGLEYQLL